MVVGVLGSTTIDVNPPKLSPLLEDTHEVPPLVVLNNAKFPPAYKVKWFCGSIANAVTWVELRPLLTEVHVLPASTLL